MAEAPTHTLIVDRLADSCEAQRLLQEIAQVSRDARVRVVDVTGKEPDSPEFARPALIAREGYFMGLEEIQDYVTRYLAGTLRQTPFDQPVPYRIGSPIR